MPRVGEPVKKPMKAKVARPSPQEEIIKGMSWIVEEEIETCPYRLGKLKLGKSVVGEVTLLKGDFPRMSTVFNELGIKVVIDSGPIKKGS